MWFLLRGSGYRSWSVMHPAPHVPGVLLMPQHRVPPGSRDGGRFAPAAHTEPDVELEPAAPLPAGTTTPPIRQPNTTAGQLTATRASLPANAISLTRLPSQCRALNRPASSNHGPATSSTAELPHQVVTNMVSTMSTCAAVPDRRLNERAPPSITKYSVTDVKRQRFYRDRLRPITDSGLRPTPIDVNRYQVADLVSGRQSGPVNMSATHRAIDNAWGKLS